MLNTVLSVINTVCTVLFAIEKAEVLFQRYRVWEKANHEKRVAEARRYLDVVACERLERQIQNPGRRIDELY